MNQKTIAIMFSLALVVAACGGGGPSATDTEGGALEEGTSPNQDQTVTTTTTTVAQAGGDTSELAGFRGVVVIGSDRYEFALAGTALNCMQILNRSFSASGALIDADGNEVVLPEGGRSATLRFSVDADGIERPDSPASIIVKDNENDTRWAAGVEFEGSEIGSVTIEDGARGTAIFIEDNVREAGGTPRSVTGTFELSC